MKIIGIDPGLKGGITLMIDGTIMNMILMPTYEETLKTKTKKGKFKKKNHIDAHKFADFLFTHKDAKIYMEKVNPFAGMGSVSSTSMAISIGRLEGVMVGMGFTWTYITPGQWQKSLWKESDRVMRANPDKKTKQGNTDTKATSLNTAKRLFPTVNFVPKGCSIPSDGLYDSALIAEHGHRQEKLK